MSYLTGPGIEPQPPVTMAMSLTTWPTSRLIPHSLFVINVNDIIGLQLNNPDLNSHISSCGIFSNKEGI